MPGGRSLTRAGLVAVPAAVLVALALSGGGPAGVPEAVAAQPAAPAFKLEEGDHVCVVGTPLADRMQHDGWLETALHALLPEHDLVIRNLGYSGDEVTQRLRSLDFGTPDQWLAGSAPIPKPQDIADKSVVLPNRFEK